MKRVQRSDEWGGLHPMQVESYQFIFLTKIYTTQRESVVIKREKEVELVPEMESYRLSATDPSTPCHHRTRDGSKRKK